MISVCICIDMLLVQTELDEYRAVIYAHACSFDDGHFSADVGSPEFIDCVLKTI